MKALNILALQGTAIASLSVDFSTRDSILDAARIKAQDVMQYYHGREYGHTLGIMDAPYFWWQAGALWGTMIDYWKLTGDASFNDIVQEALLSQTGPDEDFMPPNVTAIIGHDDQAFWGMSAMLAAESGFQEPNPAEPQWLALAQTVYNVQKESKAENNLCGGGLRWQFYPWSSGYDYKNTIANGAYFNLAARLARYTDDSTYAVEAETTFEWLRNVSFVDENYNVFDGAHTDHDCKDINRAQFSYNAAILLQGSAFMWDMTRQQRWADHVDGLLNNLLSVFFRNGVAFEPMCEPFPANSSIPTDACTTDMRFYKGFAFRWMADTARLCPWTKDRIMAAIRASAEAAVRACTGGPTKRLCGMSWQSGVFDSDGGLGQEMNALSALMTLLVESEDGGGLMAPPVSHATERTSVGDADAGKGRFRIKGRRGVLRPTRRV